MLASDYADELITHVTEKYPYLRGNSVIVMALIKACDEVLELKGAAESAQEPRKTLGVGETTPASSRPRSWAPVQPCIRITAPGPDVCSTCSEILQEWVPWNGHTTRESTLIKSLKGRVDHGY